MFLCLQANISLCKGAQFSHYSHNYHMLVFAEYTHEEEMNQIMCIYYILYSVNKVTE